MAKKQEKSALAEETTAAQPTAEEVVAVPSVAPGSVAEPIGSASQLDASETPAPESSGTTAPESQTAQDAATADVAQTAAPVREDATTVQTAVSADVAQNATVAPENAAPETTADETNVEVAAAPEANVAVDPPKTAEAATETTAAPVETATVATAEAVAEVAPVIPETIAAPAADQEKAKLEAWIGQQDEEIAQLNKQVISLQTENAALKSTQADPAAEAAVEPACSIVQSIEVRMRRPATIGGIDYEPGQLIGSIVLVDGITINYLVDAIRNDFAHDVPKG